MTAAIEGEGAEFRQMYPRFVAEAEAEGNKAALTSFRHAMAVEEVHHGLFSEGLKALHANKDLPLAPMYVCSVCGFTVAGEAPDKCPICGAPRKSFMDVA